MQSVRESSGSAQPTKNGAVAFAILAMTGALACASPRATGSAASTEAGADACAGISEAELEMSPLEAPYAIERISPLHRYLWTGRGARRVPVQGSAKLTGVLVTLHTPDRTTREDLDARLQCHIAWVRSHESTHPALRSCPLAVPGISAQVRMGYGERFIIAIRSKKESAAKEVWRRARALADMSEGESEDGEQFD